MAQDRRAELRDELQRVRDAIASAGTDRHAAAFDMSESRDDATHGAAATRYSKALHDLEMLRARAARLEDEISTL